MKRKEDGPRLEPKYYGLPPLKLKPMTPDILVPEDPEQTLRRTRILQVVQGKLTQKDLRTRLAESEERSVGNILNAGLFGHLEDETLLADLLPQGRGVNPLDKLSSDPLWRPFINLLDMKERGNVLLMFSKIERFSKRFEDETQEALAQRMLRHSSLKTLGDARRVPPEGWLNIPGIGEVFAQTLITSFAKIS